MDWAFNSFEDVQLFAVGDQVTQAPVWLGAAPVVGLTVAQSATAVPGEAEIQRVVASIPVKRLRQAGVLELLLELANEADTSSPAVAPAAAEKDLADMNLDDLVNAAFMNDDDD